MTQATLRETILQKKLFILLVTGATRSGKTTLAEWLKASRRDSERIRIVSQDDHYPNPKGMRMVALQGAPYVKVTCWDDDNSVDWDGLHAAFASLVDDVDEETTIVVEGHALIADAWLLELASTVVCVAIDMWHCFELRVSAGGKRQAHLPYMIEAWRLHVARFDAAEEHMRDASKFKFVDTDRLAQLTASSKRGVDRLAVALDVLNSVCTLTLGDFMHLMHNNAPTAPSSGTHQRIELDSFVPDDLSQREGVLMAVFLGVALGDASGAWCEFHRGRPVVWRDGQLTVPLIMAGRGGVRGAPAGAITDDFQMTLLAFKTIAANRGTYDRAAHTRAYIEWASQMPGGIGNNTRALFQNPRIADYNRTHAKYIAAWREAHADPSKLSRSNGTLMRASAFLGIAERGAAMRAAVEDAAVSNNNPLNTLANALYVSILFDVHNQDFGRVDIREWLTPAYIDECAATVGISDVKQTRAVVLHAISSPHYDATEADGDMNELVNSKDKKGFVLVALWVALRYYRDNALKNERFGETIRRVVELGGDTDTNAAITGALIAGRIGLAKLMETERFNLQVLLNVPYHMSTIKVIEGLTPANLPRALIAARNAVVEDARPRQTNKRRSPSDDDDDETENSHEEKRAKK